MYPHNEFNIIIMTIINVRLSAFSLQLSEISSTTMEVALLAFRLALCIVDIVAIPSVSHTICEKHILRTNYIIYRGNTKCYF